jgi:hypothetical protein
MTEFEMNAAIVDVANPAKYADDGRNAFLRLENNAMGGGGVNTAAFYMRQLFFPNMELPMKQRAMAHAEAYHQLLQCAGVTLDSLVTQHLVHIVGNDRAYMVVVHEASKPAVSYADANSLIMGCISRIELSTPESHSTA